MNYIIRSEFGSTVYGTKVPTSDVDIKGVFIPTAEDILLQRRKECIRYNTKDDITKKNTAADIDEEYWSIQKYMNLLVEGQTPALDLLFTPEKHFIEKPAKWWDVIRENKKYFLHSGTNSYIGYTKQQANRYGIKGSRVAASRVILDFLSQFENYERLRDPKVHMKLYELIYVDPNNPIAGNKHDHIQFVDIKSQHNKLEQHLEVCNRKVPLHVTVKYAKELFQRIFDEYGARALQAEKNMGCDWKALGHAIRVANEAEELLLTGNITFPRPERLFLLKVRKGELPYQQVANIIEEGLKKMETLPSRSILPSAPNVEWVNELIEVVHEEVLSEHKTRKYF